MKKPKKVEFSLIAKDGVPIEDTKRALGLLEKKIKVLHIAGNIGFYCRTLSTAYESLFDTCLVEKDCTYRHWKTRKKVTHKYFTNENEPTIPNSLEDYFESVGKVGIHHHLR